MSYITELQGPSPKLQAERRTIIAKGDEDYFRTEIVRQKLAELTTKDRKKLEKKLKDTVKKLKD
jgi:hypothetical protein